MTAASGAGLTPRAGSHTVGLQPEGRFESQLAARGAFTRPRKTAKARQNGSAAATGHAHCGMVFSFTRTPPYETRGRHDPNREPAAPVTQLNSDQINRYKRHLILPEVGMEGQKKLLNAKVLCIGAGGLGCPISLYLAAAGVGTIGLADVDVVSPCNLQRQVLFGVSSVGEDKVKAAAKRLPRPEPRLQRRRAQDRREQLERAGPDQGLRHRHRRHRQLSRRATASATRA